MNEGNAEPGTSWNETVLGYGVAPSIKLERQPDAILEADDGDRYAAAARGAERVG